MPTGINQAFTRLSQAACAVVFLASFSGHASAQSLRAEITVVSTAPARLRVEGSREPARGWSFRKSYAGVSGISERVENFNLRDERGDEVPYRVTAPGEYDAARPAPRFAYEVKPEPPASLDEAAHVSWLTGERGVLMLGDLLPLTPGGARLRVTLPAGWTCSTIEKREGGGYFEVRRVDEAVIFCGRGLRDRRGRTEGLSYLVTTAGDWAFSDQEAAESVAEILKSNAGLVGTVPRKEVMVALLPPPRPAPATQWSAEARGGTVTLVSGRLPSKVAALTRLDGALAHELFHLWVPNGLALTGDYAWFYEGFTNYHSLLVGVRRGQLTFADYLRALGDAYDRYKSLRGGAEIPLSADGRDRWAGNPSLVYHKGMLVAFLYDLSLSLRSGGSKSLSDVYREIFRRHAGQAKQAEANGAVVSVLKGMGGMGPFVEKYILAPDSIELPAELAPFGLKIEPGGVRTRVAVTDSPTRPQQELLKKFGYNNKTGAESDRRPQRTAGR